MIVLWRTWCKVLEMGVLCSGGVANTKYCCVSLNTEYYLTSACISLQLTNLQAYIPHIGPTTLGNILECSRFPILLYTEVDSLPWDCNLAWSCNWGENLGQHWIMDEWRWFLYRVGQRYVMLWGIFREHRNKRQESLVWGKCEDRIHWLKGVATEHSGSYSVLMVRAIGIYAEAIGVVR